MSYKDTVQKILDVIGGEKNVNRVTHCVTRLRLELKDENLVNDDDVKKIPGVIGIMKKNGQYQIILGNDVANYYKEFVKLGNFESDSVVQGHKGNILERIIEYIAGSMTPIIPAMLGSNLAQGAASMAVALKSKNNNTKQIAFAAGFSALLAGITEPALYGVTLKYKKPLYAAMIGGGLAGLFAGLTSVKAYLFAVPSLIALPQFIYSDVPSNIVNALIVAVISVVITFVLAYIFGIDEEESSSNLEVKAGVSNKKMIFSPISGEIIPLSDVQDKTFSDKLIGDGVAIIPSEGKVYAPFDGKITNIFPTKHAIGLKSDEGVELLIHIGLDTVELKGQGFISHVEEGDRVFKNQLIFEMDLNLIKTKGYETVTPVIVTNTNDFLDVLVLPNNQTIEHSKELLVIL
ncbi:glucose PTS transporter subunit IIA [Streptococcus pneumoniae]|uniref:glucose PTS transporter subunit IIA n=2 Tax=Streptococcus pneumoniae TaxID=1313 RepID=UPI000765092F|nr:glucose PTS transporter subunit IIA [Streptococcus pneumoniae]MDS8538091.1 glucose PTS transporter subunit IIA [Streptococcus pneumoniae]MDV8271649.1 glucose PTS transporter subunit IIA [Streptococcus pneumoniae]MDV8271656.1 glucose PTS transporter subunit IIA [Streptococcus pneumoniae]MDV8297139.1 glucose PTS transporter subunit IIA [Streptococcus pneumoniae]MDV8315628.1 glucose PTS transporter subunit IIA [Streptococcus pneumoniae]